MKHFNVVAHFTNGAKKAIKLIKRISRFSINHIVQITCLMILLILCLVLFLYYQTNKVNITRINIDVNTEYPHQQEFIDSCDITIRLNRSDIPIADSVRRGIILDFWTKKVCEKTLVEKYYYNDIINNIIDSVIQVYKAKVSYRESLKHTIYTRNSDSPERKTNSQVISTKWQRLNGEWVLSAEFISAFKNLDEDHNFGFFFTSNQWHRNRFLKTNTVNNCILINFDRLAITSKKRICIDFMSPMLFVNTYPVPDQITATKVIYYDAEKINEIIQNGIYIYADSIIRKNTNNLIGLIITTLFSAIFAMFITYIIEHSKTKLK